MYVSNQYYEREKNVILLLIPNAISIEEKLCNEGMQK